MRMQAGKVQNIGVGFCCFGCDLAECGSSQAHSCKRKQCNDFFQFFHKKILLIDCWLFLYGKVVIAGVRFLGNDYKPALLYVIHAGRQCQKMIPELCGNTGIILG